MKKALLSVCSGRREDATLVKEHKGTRDAVKSGFYHPQLSRSLNEFWLQHNRHCLYTTPFYKYIYSGALYDFVTP